MDRNFRRDFPILSNEFDPQLSYLDNTATTQKPACVIDVMTDFLKYQNATVHRGIYGLSQEATLRCDKVRDLVASFINASRSEEIIFTRGATESINLVAHSFARAFFEAGDEIIITEMEHHANIVPWQQICKEKDLKLVVLSVSDKGELDLTELLSRLSHKTKLVAFTHISNVLGTVNPVKEMISLIRQHTNAKILIDGAQAIAHQKVDVQDLDCDFYVFSGHKMYGPTGIGVLYGKYECLDQMTPFLTGGDMIELVAFDNTTFAEPPARFEAGTPPIVEIIGLGECIHYIQSIGFDIIQQIEMELHDYAYDQLKDFDGITILGQSNNKAAIISFIIDTVHPHDVGQFLDNEGVAVRVGHHCAQPLMTRYNVPATVRVSFSFYNLKEEVDAFVRGLKKVQEFFQ